MKRAWLYNLLWNAWFAMATVGIVALGVILYQTYREYSAFKAKEIRLTRLVQQAQQDLDQKQKYGQHLLQDPTFMAWLVRERLGYTNPGEIVFRFEKRSDDTQHAHITPVTNHVAPNKRSSLQNRPNTRH